MPVGQSIVERDIDGKPAKFHKLNSYDRMEIAEKVRKERRAQLEANLATAKATPEQLMAELEQFDDAFPRKEVMFPYIQTEAGRLDVFERALRRAGNTDPKAVLENFTPDEDDGFLLAMELCGIKIRKPEPAKAEDTSTYGDGVENPQQPVEESYLPPAKT